MIAWSSSLVAPVPPVIVLWAAFQRSEPDPHRRAWAPPQFTQHPHCVSVGRRLHHPGQRHRPERLVLQDAEPKLDIRVSQNLPQHQGPVIAWSISAIAPVRVNRVSRITPRLERYFACSGWPAGAVRAENLIRGCDQQRCPRWRPAVMITAHLPAVRLPPDHADGLMAAAVPA